MYHFYVFKLSTLLEVAGSQILSKTSSIYDQTKYLVYCLLMGLTIFCAQDQFAGPRDEFSNEVELLAKIDHRNLVRLLGFTDKGHERIIITEYVPNGTLREHLDGTLHFLIYSLHCHLCVSKFPY